MSTNRQSQRRATHRKAARVAMTLPEVMVVAAVSTILCGVAMSLLIGLRDWDQRMRMESRQNEQSMRLSETLRSDIRSATDVASPSPDAIVIRFPGDAQIRYELSDRGCQRIENKPGEAAPRTDWFDIGEVTAWTLTPVASGRRPAFTITLKEDPDTPPDSHRPAMLVHAAQGADTATQTK